MREEGAAVGCCFISVSYFIAEKHASSVYRYLLSEALIYDEWWR